MSQDPIDLFQFVREVLDGVVGEIELTTQTAAIAGTVELMQGRIGRVLNASERSALEYRMAREWNARGLPSASWFHSSDGRYFANDADRRAHQRMLNERAARHAARVAHVHATRQTPLELRPEFSESREEPFGPGINPHLQRVS